MSLDSRSESGTAPVANAPAGAQPADLDPTDRPVATPARTVHMVGHAHLDPVWLWPWQEGYQEARATFTSAVHRMLEYPDFVFTSDQVVLLSWVEESDPELFAEIRRRVAEGRWQLVGGWWVEPDCNLPGGESFARQGLYGQRYLADRFGVTATVGMNADPFGHHAMLPQILRLQGMDSYVFLRPGPHEARLPGSVFWWESPDGSRVLAYRIPYEYGSPPGDVAGQADRSLGQLDPDMAEVMVFYGVGNHGGGPTRANLDSIHRYDRMGTFGRMVTSSPRRFFDAYADRVGPEGMAHLPVWRGDLQHHAPGCYSAHSGIKAWQRRAQAAVLTAERWAVVGARAAGLDYPREDLRRAWHQVLFNQFHDILPGSAIEPAYADARDQLGEAVAVAKRITTRVHNVLARRIDVPLQPGTQPVVVFNPHPWPVSEIVEMQYGVAPGGVHVLDAGDRVVPAQPIQSTATTDDQNRGAVAFEAELPALGYRLYRFAPGPAPVGAVPAGEPPRRLVASATRLENDLLRIEIDPATGWLSSLLDRRTGADLVAGAVGEHTQICVDPTDTWGHRVVSYAWPGEPMRLAGIRLVEAGPLRARLRVDRTWGRSILTEELILAHRSDELEVRVTLDWREPAHLLKLRFPTALRRVTATYEIPFGTLERPLDGAENPAHSWVDLSGELPVAGGTVTAGLAVVNTAKHGFDTSGGAGPSIGMTAVRSPVYSWHDPRQLDPDGLYSYQDQGVQSFRYALVPHAGGWREPALLRRSAQLGAGVRAMLESFHDGALPDRLGFVDDGGGPVMVTAVKGSEDDDAVIVRAVETTGRAATAVIRLPLSGRRIEAGFAAYQIRTFAVPADPGSPVREVDLIEWPVRGGPTGPLADEPLPGGRVRLGPEASVVAGGHSDRAASAAVPPAEQLAPGAGPRV